MLPPLAMSTAPSARQTTAPIALQVAEKIEQPRAADNDELQQMTRLAAMRPLRPIGAGATRTDKPSRPQSAHHNEARSSFSSVETGASTWNDADTVGIAWAVTGIGAPVTSGIAVPIGAH